MGHRHGHPHARGGRRRRPDRPRPARRARSAVNNTARQAGGAIGIAAFGAVAGSAAQATTFLAGLHTDALVTVALWLAVAVATLALIPGAVRSPADTA